MVQYAGRLTQQEEVHKVTDAFMRFVSFEPMSGCWLWTGFIMENGYGTFYSRGLIDSALAHRFSYWAFNGELTEGLDVDHVCSNRCCVNPDHLVLATRSQNIMRYRRKGLPDPRRLKMFCKHGHLLDDGNTYWRPNGNRSCRKCLCQRSIKFAKKKREMAKGVTHA